MGEQSPAGYDMYRNRWQHKNGKIAREKQERNKGISGKSNNEDDEPCQLHNPLLSPITRASDDDPQHDAR